MFLLSLPKGKEKASGGYSQGGSNSLFFHPAGDPILPSALCPVFPGQWGYVLLVLPTPLQSASTLGGFKGPHSPSGALTRLITLCRLYGRAGDEYMTALGAGTLPGVIILIF